MTRFDDIEAVTNAGGAEPVWRIDLETPEGELLATTEAEGAGSALIWAPDLPMIDMAHLSASTQQATLRLPVCDSCLVPDVGGGFLHPDAGNRIRVSAGVVLPDGSVRAWPRSTFLILDVEGESFEGVAELTIAAVNATHPLTGDLTNAFGFAAGEPYDAILGRLIGEVVAEGGWSVASTAPFTARAGTLNIGTSRLSTITEILESVGHELTTTPDGLVVTRSVPATTDDPTAQRWRYGEGGIPAKMRKVWEGRAAHGWKIEGGDLQGDSGPVAVVWDRDPSSLGFYDPSRSHHHLPTTRLPWANTLEQCVAAGYGKLRRHGVGPGIVEFSAPPNPALFEGDYCELVDGPLKIAGTYRVIGWRLPPSGDADMIVTAREVWDPALGFDTPANPGPGVETSFYDDFERSNSNLENLPGSPGSPAWTEIGWSWAVNSGRAVQRFDRGWSLAYVNTAFPLDQEVTVEIAAVPSGRQVGPVVRASGGSGGIDGYAALADSSGRLLLQVWQAGVPVATLGSYNHGGSLVGAEITVRAVGTSISVDVNSQAVMDASDSRVRGAHTGMLAYGGPESNAPAVGWFSAEAWA